MQGGVLWTEMSHYKSVNLSPAASYEYFTPLHPRALSLCPSSLKPQDRPSMMATPINVKRMTREKGHLCLSSPDYFAHIHDSDLLHFSTYVVGPADTLYAHKFVKINFTIPSNYPFSPPICHFVQHSGDRLHPNLYNDCGKVCLSILGTWPGEPWSQAMSVESGKSSFHFPSSAALSPLLALNSRISEVLTRRNSPHHPPIPPRQQSLPARAAPARQPGLQRLCAVLLLALPAPRLPRSRDGTTRQGLPQQVPNAARGRDAG